MAELSISTQIKVLESKRIIMHDYIISKLTERDYHAVQDAASDLREIEVKVKLLSELAKDIEELEP